MAPHAHMQRVFAAINGNHSYSIAHSTTTRIAASGTRPQIAKSSS